MDTSSLVDATIEAIYTFACDPVHPAWVDENTTPIATTMVVLKLSTGYLLRIGPCEAALESGQYPSLGLKITECDASALQWQEPSGMSYIMQPLAAAAALLPFVVQSVAESDPLGEGLVSEVSLSGAGGSHLIFRHIMPPMTLGIAVVLPGQAPNKWFKSLASLTRDRLKPAP